MKRKEIKLTAPRAQDMEVLVSDVASSVAQTIPLEPDQIEEIKLAVIEACLNSFEHSKSRDGVVTVTFCPQKDGLCIRIRDKGRGFNPDLVTTPDLDKIMSGKVKRSRGWGLKIIESMMDEVSIDTSAEGTLLTLVKKRRKKDEIKVVRKETVG